jgi:cystathionine beta-lyase family protein involved in aluminum resistance
LWKAKEELEIGVDDLYPFFKINQRILDAAKDAEEKIRPQMERIERTTEYNQQKMLAAFIRNRVSESHFAASTGYGYGDRGRDVLDRVFADAFGAEDALVRHNFVSGTHALTVALFGVLRPGDTMLSVTGLPYDTLRSVIGLTGNGIGSLKEFGIHYEQVEMTPEGKPDYEEIERRIHPGIRMVYLQRSRGYSLRPSLSVEEIGKIAKIAKRMAPDCVVMVDNCYGEFVQRTEPTSRGADLMAGSLIKNPGGGVAPTGGYIAGKKDLVEQCAYRLTAPGVGREVGATLGNNRELFMGAFHAPHVTGEALKTAVFSAALFQFLGYEVTPKYDEPRADIIQALLLGNEKSLVAFCRGVQKGAPVDSFVVPEPWDMPGYDCKVIMAAGAFTLGASIELSADAPLREPYAAWMQGGLNYHSGRLGAMLAAQSMLEQGVLKD